MDMAGSALETKDVTQANSSVLEEPPSGGSSVFVCCHLLLESLSTIPGEGAGLYTRGLLGP